MYVIGNSTFLIVYLWRDCNLGAGTVVCLQTHDRYSCSTPFNKNISKIAQIKTRRKNMLFCQIVRRFRADVVIST